MSTITRNELENLLTQGWVQERADEKNLNQETVFEFTLKRTKTLSECLRENVSSIGRSALYMTTAPFLAFLSLPAGRICEWANNSILSTTVQGSRGHTTKSLEFASAINSSFHEKISPFDFCSTNQKKVVWVRESDFNAQDSYSFNVNGSNKAINTRKHLL